MSDENSSLKEIVKGAGIVFLGLIASKIISYFYRIFIARYFGPEDYGLFAIALSIIGFGSVFALVGLPAGVTRYISYYSAREDYRRVKGVITSALKISFPVSLIIMVILFVFSRDIALEFFHNIELDLVVKAIAISIPFYSLFYIFSSAFIGFKKIECRVLSENIFFNISKLVFVIIFGILGYGVFGIAISYTIATAITFIFAAYLLETRVFPIFKTDIQSIPIKREMLYFSLPLVLSGFMGTIVMWTDTTMLGFFKNAVAVGIYNAAIPTAQILMIFPGALGALFLPVITELHSKGKEKELKTVYKVIAKWMFYLNFPVFLLLVIFSRQVLNITFGKEYIAGYVALILLGGAYLTSVFSNPAIYTLQMLKKTKNILYISIINASLNVILNFELIPIYGIGGAATASLTTFSVSTLLFVWFSYREIHVLPVSRAHIKSLIAGVISITAVDMVARLFFKNFSLPVFVLFLVAFLILYGFLILVFRGLEKEDIEMLKVIEKRSGIRVEWLRNLVKRFI